MQDIIKTDHLHHKSKNRRVYNFSEYSLPFVVLRDIHERHLSLKDVDDKQSNFAAEIKRQLTKRLLNNLGLLFSTREKVLNNFKSRLFAIKNLYKIPTREPTHEPTPGPAIEPTKNKNLN